MKITTLRFLHDANAEFHDHRRRGEDDSMYPRCYMGSRTLNFFRATCDMYQLYNVGGAATYARWMFSGVPIFEVLGDEDHYHMTAGPRVV